MHGAGHIHIYIHTHTYLSVDLIHTSHTSRAHTHAYTYIYICIHTYLPVDLIHTSHTSRVQKSANFTFYHFIYFQRQGSTLYAQQRLIDLCIGYVCMYVLGMYVYMYWVCIYVCIHGYVCMYTWIGYVCIHVCIGYVCIHVWIDRTGSQKWEYIWCNRASIACNAWSQRQTCAHGSKMSVCTAILIIIEGRFQAFQRFSSSKLVLKTVVSRFVTLNYYEMAVWCNRASITCNAWSQRQTWAHGSLLPQQLFACSTSLFAPDTSFFAPDASFFAPDLSRSLVFACLDLPPELREDAKVSEMYAQIASGGIVLLEWDAVPLTAALCFCVYMCVCICMRRWRLVELCCWHEGCSTHSSPMYMWKCICIWWDRVACVRCCPTHSSPVCMCICMCICTCVCTWKLTQRV